MSLSCSVVRSRTLPALLAMTAIPSMATMFSSTPAAFSLSFRAREELPMSVFPAATASRPAPEPVYSAVTVMSGYSSEKLSIIASQSFCMEVEPARETVPETLLGASVVCSAVAAASVAAAVVAAGSLVEPQAVMVSSAATERAIAIVFWNFMFNFLH